MSSLDDWMSTIAVVVNLLSNYKANILSIDCTPIVLHHVFIRFLVKTEKMRE